MELKPIETEYNGLRFRSRIEARWAVFFEEARISYEYEKEGFDLGGHYYLPDFWLPEKDCWVEIKGKSSALVDISDGTEDRITEDAEKCMLLAQQSQKSVLYLCGQIPNLSYDVSKHGLPVTRDEWHCLAIQGVSWTEITPEWDWYHVPSKERFSGLEPLWYGNRHNAWLFNEPALRTARMARFEHGENRT